MTSSMEGYVGISALFLFDLREAAVFFLGTGTGLAMLLPCMQLPIEMEE